MSDQQKISAEEPDWSREQKSFFEWNPSKSLLASIRRYQRAKSLGILGKLIRVFAVLQYRWWSIVTGAEIPINGDIGGGLLIPHPNGIVIHPSVKIGPNCLIFQQVTIGCTGGKPPPTLGGHVDIGAGAKILGDIHLGSHSVIAANAVVLIDVPERRTAIGIPAKIK